MSESPEVKRSADAPLDERLRELDRRITNSVEQIVRELHRDLGEKIRDRSQELLRLVDEFKPELPSHFLASGDLEPLQREATAGRRVVGDLLEATARIDAAKTQAEVLTALLEEGRRFASRTAFFLLRGESAHGWESRGFGEGDGAVPGLEPGSLESFEEVTQGVGPVAAGEGDRSALAGQVGVEAGSEAWVVPLMLRGRLAGVLWAERSGGDEPVVDLESLQLLTQNGALAIESLGLRGEGGSPTLLRRTLKADETVEEAPAELPEAVVETVEDTVEETPVELPETEIETVEEIVEETPDLPAEPTEETAPEEEAAFTLEPEPEAEPELELEDDVEPEAAVIEEPAVAEPAVETLQPEPAGDIFETTEDLDLGVSEPELDAIDAETEGEAAAEEQDIWAAADDDDMPEVDYEPQAVEVPPIEPTPVSESMEPVVEEPTAPEPAAPEPATPPLPTTPEELVGQQTVRLDVSAFQQQEPAGLGAEDPTVLRTPPVEEPLTEEVAVSSEDPTVLGTRSAPPPAAPEPAAPEPAAPEPAAPEPAAPETSAEAEAGGGSTQVQPPTDLEGPGLAFGGSAGADADGLEALHEEARRLARLLVSEIKLYNEELIEEGRRDGNVYERLREDIDRSRQMYDERIDPRVRDSGEDYFKQELLQRLAGGDPDVLGM